MSLGNALSNAKSGLAVSSRGVEIIADNLSNVQTPGFARREMHISARAPGGGVRVDGIERIVNVGLLAQQRIAEATRKESQVQLRFFQDMEDAIGLPGGASSLSQALSDFRVSIVDATSRPDSYIKLESVVKSGRALADRIRHAAVAVENSRKTADRSIENAMPNLNKNLMGIAKINRKISLLSHQGKSPAALVDQRQNLIDNINNLVPVREVHRKNGAVALFTKEGQSLLDGTIPTHFDFSKKKNTELINGTLKEEVSQLIVNDEVLSEEEIKFFAGGTLHAHFLVRDELAPKLKGQLDSLAKELKNLFSSLEVSSEEPSGKLGFFVDMERDFRNGSNIGLALRLRVNPAINPVDGGDLWRVRDGIDEETMKAPGNNVLLNEMNNIFEVQGAPLSDSVFSGKATIISRFADVEAWTSSERVRLEKEYSIRSHSANVLSLRIEEDSVNSDTEIQKLITMNQVYAANARVVQTVDEMMDQILRW